MKAGFLGPGFFGLGLAIYKKNVQASGPMVLEKPAALYRKAVQPPDPWFI
jgi:hypothetical protein